LSHPLVILDYMTTPTVTIDFQYLLERAVSVPDIVRDPEVRWRAVQLEATKAVRAAGEHRPNVEWAFDAARSGTATFAPADFVAAKLPDALEQGLFDQLLAGQEDRERAIKRVLGGQQIDVPPEVAYVVYEHLVQRLEALIRETPFDDGSGLYGRHTATT
jgi:hypothetical protein